MMGLSWEARSGENDLSSNESAKPTVKSVSRSEELLLLNRVKLMAASMRRASIMKKKMRHAIHSKNNAAVKG